MASYPMFTLVFTLLYGFINVNCNVQPSVHSQAVSSHLSNVTVDAGQFYPGIDALELFKNGDVQEGVTIVTGPMPHSYAWRIRPTIGRLTIPENEVAWLRSRLLNSISIYASAKQVKRGSGSIFAIGNSSTPWLSLMSSVPNNLLKLRYRILGEAASTHELVLQSPFSNYKNFSQMLLVVDRSEVKLYVNCEEVITASLAGNIDLIGMPSDAEVFIAQDSRGKNKYSGWLHELWMYPEALQMTPWMCTQDGDVKMMSDVELAELRDDPLVAATSRINVVHSSSSLSSSSSSSRQVVVNQGNVGLPIVNYDQTITVLESTVVQMSSMIEMLKSQARVMEQRLAYLETCECRRPQCTHNGRQYMEGQTWKSQPCTQCICQGGESVCRVDTSLPECQDPCLLNPCSNSGTCLRDNQDFTRFTCECMPGTSGSRCQHKVNVCFYPSAYGDCFERNERFFYNYNTHACERFAYSGCGGNTNNFATLQQCQNQCLEGACCYRTYIKQTQDGQLLSREVLLPGIKCQELFEGACRALEDLTTIPDERYEVVAFHPGKSCNEASCELKEGCKYGERTYVSGEQFSTNCQQCRCLPTGSVECRCSEMTIRKEIRDMTQDELNRFQDAIRQLRLSGGSNPWEQFRDLYMCHIMEAHNINNYLIWHRVYLREVERQLQEIDCSLALPYFDFTTDMANLTASIIWQPNYFGGDGYGACVLDHPFRKENAWDPCIIRRFTDTAQLPSKLDIATAMATGDYRTVSECLQTILGHVFSFVGGHVVSSGAPYDPLFYALQSYVDMLFWRWQQKPANRNKLPEFTRTIPLVPFNVRPVDVLESETQLCVTYALQGLGDPCNSTEVAFNHAGFDNRGYDRNGFDRRGYNRDGFDKNGYSARGQQDTRDLFPYDGYNFDGYNREGYDRRGYNRYGYQISGYNRDGFNIYGYDRQGFDRYDYDADSYDRRGYDRNGLDRNRNPDTSSSYGSSGYSQFCLDRKGFNTEGFDIYGFNSRFYDELYCNYTFNGPHTPRISLRLDELLFYQSKDFLMSIPRTCLPPGALSKLWFEQIWTAEQKTLPDRRIAPSSFPTSMWSGRFCFDVETLLSHCACEQNYAVCRRNPCNVGCSGYPDATCYIDFCGSCTAHWYRNGVPVNCGAFNGSSCYDGVREYPDGVTWQPDACTACSCRSGTVSCEVRECQPVTCDFPALAPGDCCKTCNHCDYSDTLIFNGRSVESADQCSQCRCTDGNVECDRVACPAARCRHPRTPRDGCCPICSGCEYEGRRMRNQGSFQQDRCTTCTCNNGNVDCEQITCRPLTCQDQITPASECCPRCVTSGGCEYEGMPFTDGEFFTPMSNPCLSCFCSGGIVRCNPLPCDEPNCLNPVLLLGACCAICPDVGVCVYQGRQQQNGAQWISDDQCQNCVCNQGNVVCRDLQTCEATCDNGFIPEGQCCPVCDDCLYEGRLYDNGGTFRSADSCSQCRCYYGTVTCRESSCPSLSCIETESAPGQCCPVCKGCVDRDGQRFDHLQTFVPSYDVCKSCQCREGTLTCTTVTCDAACPHPIIRPEECCPMCDGCFYQGVEYTDGSMVGGRDPCQECICRRGTVDCRVTRCPRPTCPNPVTPRGQCCPVCDQCVYDGQPYQSGDEFMSPSDPCEKCICQGGEVTCSPLGIQCNTQCSHPFRTPDQCCPGCDDCEFQNRRVNNGQRFRHPTDICQTCECTDGSIACSIEDCPRPNCRNPVRESGQCCPVCPDISCYSDGQEYREGEVWDSPSNPCLVCRCSNQQVRCEQRECPQPSCTNPARSGTSCCPVCGDCEYDNRYFYNGQRFANPLDRCEVCICEGGNIRCNAIECPPVTCSNPITDPGECCPRCLPPERCDFQGVTYENGETWADPRLECMECRCRDGNAECGLTKYCPPVNCPHPRTDGCCEDCTAGCTYNNLHYNNRDTFKGPRDVCLDCICLDGQVTCARMQCPRLETCDLIIPPQAGECCSSCSAEIRKCRYNGKEYSNGDRWEDPRLRCQQCRCTQGDVECGLSLECERPICPHPRTDGCCPDCTTGCTYEGLHMDNRAVFNDPRDPCQSCQCLEGSVICREVPCPSLSCEVTVKDPGRCCPTCAPQECQYAGKVYRVGQQFDSPVTACQLCECMSSLNVECRRKECPQIRCPHPFEGECCDTCEDCTYQGQNYVNGVKFADPDDSCQGCTCNDGNVRCGSLPCESLTCPHQRTPPNTCCPVCIEIECLFNGQTYPSGEYFEHPLDACQECFCNDGAIDCQLRPCQSPQCPYPIQNECCESCDGCHYNGVDFRTGEEFSDPFDPCQRCECQAGYVQCYDSECPTSECYHPIKRSGDCCPTCDGCLYERRPYGNGDTFPDSSNQCQSCTCLNGNVTCASASCPAANCPHPMTDVCGCPTCGGCEFKGSTYPDGVQFPDSEDPCRECMCRRGVVECQLSECPQPRCFNPVKYPERCCPTCDGCSYNDNNYGNGESFPDTVDACRICTCLNGNVNCGPKTCPRVSCTHGMPDECLCPSCDGCMYEDEMVRNGETFIDPSDMCRDCLCLQGSVSCIPRSCPPTPCSNPTRQPGECCATCPIACVEPEEPNMCEDCVCVNGEWDCVRRDCPPTNCPNAGQGMCCMECEGCTYGGKPWANGVSFPDPADVCRTCQCNFGFVSCSDPECPRVNCRQPVTPAGQCCPVCIGQCTVDGVVYENGQTYTPADDPCSTCNCRNGQIFCDVVTCSRLCSHPQTRLGECCPVCVGCEFEGIEITNNGVFIHPSNPCHNCVCRMGNVECSELRCHPTTCPSPVTPPGECCPTCPECNFDDRIYPDGSRFLLPTDQCQQCECQINKVVCNHLPCPNSDCTHPVTGSCCPICESCLFEERIYNNGEIFRPDNCRECNCLNGNVMCVTEECPVLTCDRRVRDPGQCCERCQGCLYQGFEYSSGESWISPINACINCQCQEGDTLCTEIHCLTPDFCSNPIYQPDECCPVCPGCEYDGVIYGDEERFQPRGNPCESCLCQSGSLLCLRETCESLLNCPSDSIVPPGPNECCATCRAAELTRGCTNGTLGVTTKPYNDPCFTCECKHDSFWECTRDMCPMMNCARHEQVTYPGECCPICQVCHVEETGRTYFDGQEWSQGTDNCITCTCTRGSVNCELERCQSLVCDAGFELHKPEDKCCYECKSLGEPCVYQGQVYQPNSQWMRDECTNCVCHSSQVQCQTQRCAPLQCEADEVPTQDPGNCCPRCQARPATCIAWGDPHYRTFDGKLVHFQGTCKYIMTMDCKNQDFIVEVSNDPRNGAGDVSWTHGISVIVQGNQVDLGQDGTVSVDGQAVSLPYLLEPYILVEERGGSYFVNTNVGVKVLWDGNSYVEVSVPGTYARGTCGLCGNFNSYPQDDLKLRNGQLATTDADFGNSWKVDGIDGTGCDAKDIDPCNDAGYQARKMANIKCAVLKSPRFTACHARVPPEPYFASCVYDMCACGSNDACLCDSLAAYAAECRAASIVLNWRTDSLCAVNCPAERGFIFDECGPACPRTCANKDIPDRVLAQQCLKPCVPGCNCPANKVLHNMECIDMNACPSDFRVVPTSIVG